MECLVRVYSMPNKRTFEIKPIKELLAKYPGDPCVDAFPYGPQINVLEYLKSLPSGYFELALFDPPFSPTQAARTYKVDAVGFTSMVSKAKDEVCRLLKAGGYVITFGWNSNGLGKSRGFEKVELLLVAHGASHNDTICLVERKLT